MALVDAFPPLDAGLFACDANPYLLLQQDFAELLPGSCRMMPFISRLKSVARTSEEFKPERSTMSSIGFGSSALSNSYSFFSEPLSEAASRFRCSASGCSAWTSAARTGVGSIERRAARTDDAEARQIENLHVAADVEKNRRVVDLQERLRIFRLRPVQKPAVDNLSNAIQCPFRALEGLLLHHGLRGLRGKIAGFQIRQRRTKDAIGRTKLGKSRADKRNPGRA
jgi:hypothetical protein